MDSFEVMRFTENAELVLPNTDANLLSKKSTRTTSRAIFKHDEAGKPGSSLSLYVEELGVKHQSFAQENADCVQVSKPYFSPVYLAGRTLFGFDHQSKTWCKIFTNDCFQPTVELVSPRITFDGPLMLLVWTSFTAEGLSVSNGLVADVRTGEYERVEFLEEQFPSDAIRLVGKGIYQIVTLSVDFLETHLRIEVLGARFDGTLPRCWESIVWHMSSHFCGLSFVARCNAYVDENLLCLCRASEDWESGSYMLWRVDLEMVTFETMLIQVPHTWGLDEDDESWSSFLDSELAVEVEPLECSVLICASRLMLVFLFRVGPPPADDRKTYFATVRIHEVTEFYSPYINQPLFVSMSPPMCMHTNDEGEYMSTTFVSDVNFIYICPNYTSEERDRVAAFEMANKEWSMLPSPSSVDVAGWKCWGETSFSHYPSF